jgi:hypothetical protein
MLFKTIILVLIVVTGKAYVSDGNQYVTMYNQAGLYFPGKPRSKTHTEISTTHSLVVRIVAMTFVVLVLHSMFR